MKIAQNICLLIPQNQKSFTKQLWFLPSSAEIETQFLKWNPMEWNGIGCFQFEMMDTSALQHGHSLFVSVLETDFLAIFLLIINMFF